MVARAGCLAILAFSLLRTTPSGAATTVSNVAGVELIVDRTQVAGAAQRAPKHRSPRRLGVTATRAPSTTMLAGEDALLRDALALVGTRYVWGGTSPDGFDCSGFTYYAFAQNGIRIPRTADAQFAAGHPIDGDPLPGDLVFFQTYDYGASHVGIYLGDGRFVSAIGTSVQVASFALPYYRSRYLGARRFLRG